MKHDHTLSETIQEALSVSHHSLMSHASDEGNDNLVINLFILFQPERHNAKF